MAMEDEYDPFEGTGQTAMDQAQARGDKSYSSIGSAVNVSGDDDGGASSRANRLAQQNMRQERPSFLERVQGKLGNIFGGIQQPNFDIQKPEFDPTGFYRSLPRRAEKLGGAIADKVVPGRDTPLGMLPSLVSGKLGAALSLANYMAGKQGEIDSFVDSILGKKDKPDKPELIPTPTVDQFRQGERDALDPRNLAPIQPSANMVITSRGDPLDIPVEEANPVGLSQLQRSLGGLPVEVRGGGGGSTREGGLGDFVAIASPTSRPEFLVGTRAPNIGFERTPEMRNAPNFGQMLYEDRPKNAPNEGLSPDDFSLAYFAPEPELGPYEQEVVSQNLADIIMQGMQNSTPSGGITDLRGGDNLAFFDTNRGVFGSIPNPIDVLTNKNLARQGNIYTSASTGGRGSKRSKGDLLNELSRSIGSAINFSGSNR